MGCDIHFYVEIKKNGKWYSADKWTRNPYYDDYPDEEQKYRIAYEDEYFKGRHYYLFAKLANVRSFYDPKVEPIAKPKGLPKDVSKKVKAESNRWGVDGHSHSYYTIKELLQYPWEQDREVAYFSDTIKKIAELSLINGGDLNTVRIVFWFDD